MKQSAHPGKHRTLRWSILTAVCAILLIAAIIASYVAFGAAQAVNIALHIDTYKVENKNEDAVYFESDFSSVEELEAHDKEVAEQLTGEGVVLLKNDNNALPLGSGAAVSLFSHSSVDIATCGTGSADIDTSNAPTLKEALETEGFSVNPVLWDFYATGDGSSYVRTPVKGMNGLEDNNRANYHVNEVPVSAYTADVTSSYSEYNDAAIVVITRLGGELFDLPSEEFVDGTDVLTLTQEEQDMLAMVEENFETVIVLINSTNAMSCSFLEEYDIDAALWIGYTGTWGLNAVADILSGEVNPSGRLVDTYCYDNTTAPAMVGFYGAPYANADPADTATWYDINFLDGNQYYTLYQGGIYVGYRYYETRYEDVVMGQGNAGNYNYAAEVAYPFGYGLSYTQFAWSDFNTTYDPSTDAFTVTLTVTNTGDTAGKDVVEIYFQSPYTDYDREFQIEKAAVELCGFAKTGILEPGAADTVTVTVPREELAAYDRLGAKTYILDAGDYYLTAASNAHDAVNNILAAKGYTTADGMTADGAVEMTYRYNQPLLDNSTYSVSSVTGYAITNQFDNADLSYYGTDVTYLSRSDWEGTWPQPITDLEANEEILAALNLYQTYDGVEGSTTQMPTTGADNGMTLAMMIGKDYDDPDWDALLDQLTLEEMAEMIGKGYHNTALAVSVSKPATLDDNGPQGFTQALTGVSTCHCAYSDENIMAATWNVELMKEVGRCIGNDMLDLGATGLYGPAMNTHRTAYGGRNFEYYSEDGFLAGKIAAAEVEGIQSKGIYVYIKHFALNDAETTCRCISTWCNEQAIREIYLKPFEMAVVEGGAHNVMNAFSRFGATWSGAHSGLMTEVLRNEWGMDGFAITDFSGNAAFAAYGLNLKSFDVAHGLMAGTDSWDSSSEQWTTDLLTLYADDPDMVTAMRQASHRILYTVANSHAMNGFDEDTQIVAVIPWWQIALVCLIVVLAVLTVVCVVQLKRSISAKKRSRSAKSI